VGTGTAGTEGDGVGVGAGLFPGLLVGVGVGVRLGNGGGGGGTNLLTTPAALADVVTVPVKTPSKKSVANIGPVPIPCKVMT